jgi:hypothetical protein
MWFAAFLLACVVFANQASSFHITNDYLIAKYGLSAQRHHRVTVSYSERVKNGKPILLNIEQMTREIKSARPLYAGIIEISDHNSIFANEPNTTLINLLFPTIVNDSKRIREMMEDGLIEPFKFELQSLNLTGNGLSESFLTGYALNSDNTLVNSSLFQVLMFEYFSKVKILKLSFNRFQHLRQEHFDMFYNLKTEESGLEAVLLDSNELQSIRHDTFHRLNNLKYLDLSRNKLRLIHPLTLQLVYFPSLIYVDLSHNKLAALFDFNTLNRNESITASHGLKYFYFSENEEIQCDCGLAWALKLQGRVDFGTSASCLRNSEAVDFAKMNQIELADDQCGTTAPDIITNTAKFEKISDIPILRRLSKAWFAHNVFEDNLPVTTPAPYLSTHDQDVNKTEAGVVIFEPKRVFYAWVLDEAVFECTTSDVNRTAILWKTQYGYLSNMDAGLMAWLSGRVDSTLFETLPSYKIFYMMNQLTRIHKNLTVQVS